MNHDAIRKQIDEWVATDATSVPTILEALRDSVGATEMHVRSNWQDDALAACWAKIGRAIGKASEVYEKNRPF